MAFLTVDIIGIVVCIKEGHFDLTFRGSCIVIYSYNKTNEMH